MDIIKIEIERSGGKMSIKIYITEALGMDGLRGGGEEKK